MCSNFDREEYTINDDLAEIFTLLGLPKVEQWSLEEAKQAYDEISDALDKTLGQITPLLCRKYKVSQEMIFVILSKVTRTLSVVLEMERLSLTDGEVDECLSRMNAVMRSVAEKNGRGGSPERFN